MDAKGKRARDAEMRRGNVRCCAARTAERAVWHREEWRRERDVPAGHYNCARGRNRAKAHAL